MPDILARIVSVEPFETFGPVLHPYPVQSPWVRYLSDLKQKIRDVGVSVRIRVIKIFGQFCELCHNYTY